MMISLSVVFYSLLRLCTPVNSSEIQELQVKTVKRGDDVTMECGTSTTINKKNLVWYRQSFGKVPEFLAKPYSNTLGYTFNPGLNPLHFSIIINQSKFDLHINEVREADGGEYFCGELQGNLIRFTSGTHLYFQVKKPRPTSGTTPQGSNSSNGKGSYWIFILTSSNIISVIIVGVLIGVLFKNQRKGNSDHHSNTTDQNDDEGDDDDVLNYAAVSFAKKPSSSRTSRDERHHDIYSQVQIK